MKTLISALLLVAIFSSVGFTQTSLGGKVTDGFTDEELIAANICIFRNGVMITGIATDFDGNYSINIDPGNYDVEVSYIGYATSRVEGVVVSQGRKNILHVTLGFPYVPYSDHNKTQSKNWSVDFHKADAHDPVPFKEVLANMPQACQ